MQLIYSNQAEREDPFAAIAAMKRSGQYGLLRFEGDLSALDNLFAAAADLQKTHDYAAEMQLGAKGFDNSESAAYYNAVREGAIRTARELAKTCRALLT